jgi:antitoxin YefM
MSIITLMKYPNIFYQSRKDFPSIQDKFPITKKIISLDIFHKMLYSIPVHIGGAMTIQTTYTQARDSLAKLLDQVTLDREVVVIQRRGKEEVAMIAASELESLMETAYLLRSPANAERLLSALGEALKGSGLPKSIQDLRKEVGFEL